MSMIGKTLGHYSVSAMIGKGGMGEVYRAKDQKLGRDVAIKFLPEEFAKDADRVGRFQREAKLLASLNHPNIASIYGLEESAGISFLVLELVEGDTLADRIKGGPIPVEESLKLALQIAEALEAAHEKGVIHRDLKPANIKVTPDGKVKVLDFGLAKACAGEETESNLSNSPTLSYTATQEGIILGTAAYMSPEQAKGKTVDKKTDIWAFGAVLYEMLTGKAAFQGDEVSETLASVIKGEVHLDLLPEKINPALRPMLSRCLQKDLKRRYQDIGDVRYEIEQSLADPSGAFAQPLAGAQPQTKLRTNLPWIAAALVLGSIITGVAIWHLRSTEPSQIIRFDCELPDGRQFSNLTYAALAISPDGKRIVYSTTKGLYIRSIGELAAKLIAGTEGPTAQPFFSPDGQWVGFLSDADSKLKKIDINGGTPVSLCDTVQPYGASWGADDAIVYGGLGGIMRISANGGNPEPLVRGEGYHIAPQILPDGKTVMYSDDNPPKIVLQSLESGQQKELLAGNTAKYLSTGHIVYESDNTLFIVPFELNSLEITGNTIPMVEGVYRFMGAPQYAVSNSGTLAYIPMASISVSPNIPVWVNRDGTEEPLAVPSRNYRNPHISRDGTRIAFETWSPKEGNEIYIWDLIRENMMRLTPSDGMSRFPVWSLDGKRVLFYSNQKGTPGGLSWKPADGSGETEELCSAPTAAFQPQSWSSDGETLILVEAGAGNRYDISALSMEGDHIRKQLLYGKHMEHQPQISPDGKWLAYTSNEEGKAEVYVRPFPEVNEWKKKVSIDGGNSPLWAPGGSELFYRNGDFAMAVAVETEPAFRLQKPVRLFQGSYAGFVVWLGGIRAWDIHPDGKRFLMIKPPESTSDYSAEQPRKINIVLNWFEELEKRVPTDRGN